jgi:hypothetical protein
MISGAVEQRSPSQSVQPIHEVDIPGYIFHQKLPVTAFTIPKMRCSPLHLTVGLALCSEAVVALTLDDVVQSLTKMTDVTTDQGLTDAINSLNYQDIGIYEQYGEGNIPVSQRCVPHSSHVTST